MGQIAASYDIMPRNMEVDLDTIINRISLVVPKGVRLIETKVEPIAFGLMKINAGFIIDDTDDRIGYLLEEALSTIEGVMNIKCVSNTVI